MGVPVRLSKASAYGVLATVYLAEQGGDRPVQAATVAQACRVPFNHLVKILQQLVRCGIMSSERGPRGGFQLACAPSDIPLLNVVQGIDGPILANSGLEPDAIAARPAAAQLHRMCQDVADFASERLRTATIRDLMSNDVSVGARPAGAFSAPLHSARGEEVSAARSSASSLLNLRV